MYLPVIMIERFGWWGFIAFAAPNVLGCAAFGYIVKDRGRSEAMVARHATAMTWFSLITVAYHMFFVVWLFTNLSPVPGEMYWMPATTAAVVLAIGGVLSFLPNRDWLWVSAAVYALSLVALWLLGFDSVSQIKWSGKMPLENLIWLTPTLFFGFLLCPYLDLTFHRAIQFSPSRHAFAIFGVAFAIMLVLTCVVWFDPSRGIGGALPVIAIAHIVAQSTFTVGAHLREIRLSRAIVERLVRWFAMLVPLFAVAVLYIARDLSDHPNVGENVYLRFLVFYGLIFPAFVAIVMVGSRDASTRIGRMCFILAVVACMPLYEFGFIQGRTWLLTVALAVLASAAFIARAGHRRPT